MKSTTNEPTFLFDALPLHWQMTRWEKYGFMSILQAAKPKVGIEIGTYKGGSLQVISNHAEKVYSIDLDASLADRLAHRLPNVEFLTGDSREILPALLDRIAEHGEELGFVFIDGDPSTEGVRSDINAILRYTPIHPLYIVFHDSFNPDCRRGILAADWSKCDYVHYVEVDFVPGVYHFEAVAWRSPSCARSGVPKPYPFIRARKVCLRQCSARQAMLRTPYQSNHAKGKTRPNVKIVCSSLAPGGATCRRRGWRWPRSGPRPAARCAMACPHSASQRSRAAPQPDRLRFCCSARQEGKALFGGFVWLRQRCEGDQPPALSVPTSVTSSEPRLR
jgi:Methyltransferase domain